MKQKYYYLISFACICMYAFTGIGAFFPLAILFLAFDMVVDSSPKNLLYGIQNGFLMLTILTDSPYFLYVGCGIFLTGGTYCFVKSNR